MNEDDIRYDPPEWLPYFEPGGKSNSSWSARLEALREILTSDGRSLTQGAIGWLWARSENATPIPGARTPEQVKENAGAMSFGPLTPQQMNEIDSVLGRDSIN